MIVAHLSGGLGNQFFQYAMARQISVDLGVELRLDLFSYRSDRLRSYALDRFRISARPASWGNVLRLCPMMAIGRLAPRPIYERVWLGLNWLGVKPACRSRVGESISASSSTKLFHHHIMAERQTTFDVVASRCPDGRLIVGNWPNEKYFTRIRKELLGELEHKHAPSSRDQDILKRMRIEESTAVHIRRGDKVGNPTFKATSVDYCLKAMQEANRCLHNPQFYIFSDDPAWVVSQLTPSSNITIIDHHAPDQVDEDFRLMRACKNQIIASSSLSWWAAWLNDNPKKLVISPPASQWVQRPGCDTSQILPSEWIVVEAKAD